MDAREPRTDSATPDCADVPALTQSYIAGELEHEAVLRLRAHLARCSECMQSYRTSVGTAATLGRRAGAERERRMVQRSREARAARALGHGPPEKPHPRHFRLRMVLVPAVLIFVILQLANLGPAPGKITLVAARGAVHVDDRAVDLEDGEELVLPGRWVHSARFSEASLDARACRLQLGESTSLLVESARPVRFRLRRGTVRIEGSATFVTVLGLVEVTEGRGSLLFDDHGLFLEPSAGSWVFVDPTGRRPVPPGREERFGMEL